MNDLLRLRQLCAAACCISLGDLKLIELFGGEKTGLKINDFPQLILTKMATT
jgi:hypothetical protein